MCCGSEAGLKLGHHVYVFVCFLFVDKVLNVERSNMNKKLDVMSQREDGLPLVPIMHRVTMFYSSDLRVTSSC